MPDPSFRRSIGMPFIELQTVDSTNNYALSQLHAGMAEHGCVVFSHEQTAGKGQRGKKWTSSAEQNIALSIILKPTTLNVAGQFQLNVCIAVGLSQFFEKYAGDDTKIKWPNDLYWRDRKAGGILIESGVRNRESGENVWDWAIAGIGININQTLFPADLTNPVSLKQITGKEFDTVGLAKELCRILDKKYQQLISEGFENIYQDYLLRLYKKDQKVKLKAGSRVFETTIKTVSSMGKLVTQHNGIEEEFDFGEIEWVI